MIIAIDPGMTGGLAYYDPDLRSLQCERMPVQWRMVNKKKRHEVDAGALFRLLRDFPAPIDKIVCEEPHAMPGAGATSQFSFGSTCGAVKAVLACLKQVRDIGAVLYVDPSAWKVAMQCPSDKWRARRRAMDFFPEYGMRWAEPGGDGMAEAALMAWYGAHYEIKQKVRTPVKRKA